jgi:hypothetical protein
VQRVRPNISPETVQPNLLACRLCTRDFKHSRGDSQTSVCRNDLDACDPLRQLTSLARRQFGAGIEITSIFLIDGVNLLACAVCKSSCSAEMGVEVTIAFENVELICCLLFVLFTR